MPVAMRRRRVLILIAGLGAVFLSQPAPAFAAVGEVLSQTKISQTSGGFGGALSNFDRFGDCAAYLGDVDGDGVGDLAVAAGRDDDGGSNTGAVWILFLNSNGSVKGQQKISQSAGDFQGNVAASAEWGECLAEIGDLNYDGVPDLAVADWKRVSPGAVSTGAVWILFLESDGTVKSEQLIDATDIPGLEPGARFGRGMGAAGDVDGDGVMDLAVGVSGNNGGGSNRGGVWILFLEPDGWVKDAQLIADGVGGLPGGLLADNDYLGIGKFDRIGDLDGNGVPDLAVGAQGDDTGGTDRGAVWIFFLQSDGTLAGHQKIASGTGGFTGTLDDGDQFGDATARLGDIDGDGVVDIAVSASDDDDGGADYGAVWVLFLNGNGTVKGHQKISATTGGFGGALGASDAFGFSLAALPDLDGIGTPRLAATAIGDDDGGSSRGAVWLLELEGDAQPAVCGDFIREAAEECDDGNTASADGCSATCEDEDVVLLAGTAAGGGSLSLTVSGEAIAAPTSVGQSGAQVLAATATSIGSNPTLAGLGVYAIAAGDALYTNGSVTSQSVSDAGLLLNARGDLTLDGSTMSFDLEIGFPKISLVTQQPVGIEAGLVRAGVVGPLATALSIGPFSSAYYWYSALSSSYTIVTSIFGTRTLYARANPRITNIGCGGDPNGLGLGNPPGALGQHDVPARGFILGGGDAWCGLGVPATPFHRLTAFPGPFLPLSPIGQFTSVSHSSDLIYGNVLTDGTAVIEIQTGYTTPYLQPVFVTRTQRGVSARRDDLEGVLNTVTPIAIRVSSQQGAGAFGRFRLRFVPEAGHVFSLSAGVLGTLALARWRRRHR